MKNLIGNNLLHIRNRKFLANLERAMRSQIESIANLTYPFRVCNADVKNKVKPHIAKTRRELNFLFSDLRFFIFNRILQYTELISKLLRRNSNIRDIFVSNDESPI